MVRLLLVLVALPLLARLALELPGVRAAILRAVAQRVAEATTLQLVVDDWQVALTSGRFVVEGLVLRDSGGREVLAAPRADVDVDLSALFGGGLVLERLHVDRPRFDLGALPELPPREQETAPLELAVHDFVLREGSVEGAPLPEDAAGWLSAWRGRRIDASGSLRDGEIALALDAKLEVEGERIDRRELTVEVGGLSGPLAGPWRAEGVVVRGDGLEVDVTWAELGAGENDPWHVAGTLAADLGRIAPDLRGGLVQADADLDLRRRRGRLELRAERVPAELLEPWLGREVLDRIGASGSTLQATADLDLASGGRETASGEARVVWDGERAPLLEAHLRLTEGGVDSAGVLDWESLGGELVAKASRLPAEALRPFLGSERFAQLSLAGATLSLDGQATASAGEVAGIAEGTRSPGALVATLDGTLDKDGERWLVVRASTVKPPAKAGPRGLAAEVNADLWPELAGERGARGTVWVASRSEITSPTLDRVDASVVTSDVTELWRALEERVPRLLATLPLPEAFDPSLLSGPATARARLSGAAASPDVVASLDWTPSPGSSLELRASGRASAPLSGEAQLRVVELDLARLRGFLELAGSPKENGAEDGAENGAQNEAVAALAGRLSGDASFEGSLEEPRGSVSLRATGLVLGESLEPLDEVTLVARGDARGVEVESVEVRAPALELRGTGWFEPRLPLGAARASFDASAPDSGVERARFDVKLADGELTVRSTELVTKAGAGEIEAKVPLVALRRVEGLPEGLLRALPESPAGVAVPPIDLRANMPALSSEGLASIFEVPENMPDFELSDLEIVAALDPSAPAAAEATLRIGGLVFEVQEPELGSTSLPAEAHTVRLARPLQAELRDGELRARDVQLLVDDHALEVDAEATLAADWTPGDAMSELVRDVRAEAQGVVPAAAFGPVLAGGVARGLLDLRAEVSGPPNDLSGSLSIDGAGSSVVYRSPYLTRIADPVLEVDLREGNAVVRSGSFRLNEGQVTLTGEAVPQTGLDLRAEFTKVRYRLDYGLSVELGGELQLLWPLALEGPPVPGRASGPLLRGDVRVERGLVRRDIDLQREVLAVLRGVESEDPSDLARQLGLDLDVSTASGVRVRNNVADLRVRWSTIEVRGTLAEPILHGVVEVDPGGTVFAYGQRARVDRGMLRLPGRLDAEPQIAFDVTTSFEDPTLLAVESSSLDPFAGGGVEDEGPAAQQVALAGFADYVGGRLAAGLDRGLGDSVRVSLRPIGLLNEADPDARLTVGRDLNRYLTLGVAVNLRQAEQRTYLLDVREVPQIPRMLGQVFTNEEGNEGVTVEQSLELGGTENENEPRLRNLRIEAPDEVAVRSLRRAIVLAPGDPVYDGALFDVEIEASDALVRQGFADPRVTVTSTPARRAGAVDLELLVEPGPRAQVAFLGDPPPADARSAIATLYRSDYYEPAALDEMARATESALRGVGFLEPKATVRVAPVSSPEETRQVVVEAEGGRRVDVKRVIWDGAQIEASEKLDERFESRRSRVELAAGLPSADQAVRATLGALGFPEAKVGERSLSADGEELRVFVTPGLLVSVASVEVRGDAPEGLPSPSLAAGDALRSDRLATAAFELEDALRERGYLEARVDAAVSRAEGERSAAVAFEVDAGEQYRLGALELDGLGATSPGLVRRLVGVSPGEVIGQPELEDARRALFESRLFSGVVVQPELEEGGDAKHVRLGVEVEEVPRYQLGYGLRYETEEGLGAVVDAVDRNLAGWGLQLGGRLLYREDDQEARVWLSSPRLGGTHYVLDGFVSLEEEVLDAGEEVETFIDSFETGLQLSRPLGERFRAGVYAKFREETFAFEDPFFGPFEETLRFPVLGLQFRYRETDDPFQRNAQGLWASLDLSGTDESLGGQLEFLRLFGQVGLVVPSFRLAGRRVEWAQLYRIGAADAFEQELVRGERFFAGGSYSVRGYPREGLGPVETLGDVERPLGGEALFVVNQELRVPLFGDFGGVLFVDGGNVWEQVDEFGDDLVFSVGVGARWRSPIGLCASI